MADPDPSPRPDAPGDLVGDQIRVNADEVGDEVRAGTLAPGPSVRFEAMRAIGRAIKTILAPLTSKGDLISRTTTAIVRVGIPTMEYPGEELDDDPIVDVVDGLMPVSDHTQAAGWKWGGAPDLISHVLDVPSIAVWTTVAAGNGTLATNTQVIIPVTAASAADVLSAPWLAVYASGTALQIGTGQDVEAQLYNDGTSATSYQLLLRNNSAVTVAYRYAITGITP